MPDIKKVRRLLNWALIAFIAEFLEWLYEMDEKEHGQRALLHWLPPELLGIINNFIGLVGVCAPIVAFILVFAAREKLE